MSSLDFWSMAFVFMLSAFVGFQVIQNVSRLLHTPLMSLTNAISAIAVVGSIMIAGEQATPLTTVLGTIAVGLLLVRFRGHSPKVEEVLRDGRYALHSPMDNPDGVGGEFMVRGWMEQIGETHPAVQRFVHESSYPLAFYAMSVEEAVGTTYEGEELEPVYRRWRAEARGASATSRGS